MNQSFQEKIQGIQTSSTNITLIQEQINILSLNASIEALCELEIMEEDLQL